MLNISVSDIDKYLAGITTKQIRRNTNAKPSSIYINGAEIEITENQSNLFAGFGANDTIKLIPKVYYFLQARTPFSNPTSADVIINPNAVITGNAGNITFTTDGSLIGGFANQAWVH